MNKKVFLYQFINIDGYKTNDVISFVKNINGLGATVCFDLEDSIKNSYVLKQKENIIKFIRKSNKYDYKFNLGIRINNLKSKKFIRDLDFLKLFNKHLPIESIFIPKIKELSDIEIVISKLQKNNITYTEVIPIIETKNGLDNIIKIGEASNELFNKIAFGHCDYNFDNNIFPFYHQNHKKYWIWINKITAAIEPFGKSFINSPLLFLNNDILFAMMLTKLDSICKNQFGQISLTLHQTKLCSKNGPKFSLEPAFYNTDKKKCALNLIANYKKNKYNNKSFAIEPSNRYLISPQEFKAAKNYLTNYEKD